MLGSFKDVSAHISGGRDLRRFAISMGVLAVVAIGLSLTSLANIDDIPTTDPSKPIFAISKSLCEGDPSTHSDPMTCDLSASVPEGAPVFYRLRVTNPWGQPAQTIYFEDTYPASFSQSGPVSCFDQTSAAVPIMSGQVSPVVAAFNLDVATTVACYVPGTFTMGGTFKNTLTARSNFNVVSEDDVNTVVIPSTPIINFDLEVSKTATPSLDVTTGAGVIDYDITVRNVGTASEHVGQWFQLHDKLSLAPNSVPFHAALSTATCTATPGTDCLDPVGPFEYGNPNVLVGTSAPENFFRWGFAFGDGMIAAGGEIKLSIRVKVDQIQGLSCIAAIDADGLRNTAFFTLSDGNSAKTEGNPANNTGSAQTKIITGNTVINPNCGRGHLSVSKQQIKPVYSPVKWGDRVGYEIKIENKSVPAQPITINVGDFEDWISQGINTPPFKRTHYKTSCISSTDSAICNSILNNLASSSPDFDYTFYGQTNEAWTTNTGEAFTLQYGHEIVVHTFFEYIEPDCETVPAAPEKPIWNNAIVKYKATPVGALSVGPPYVNFIQGAKAKTLMEDQPACDFKVTKRIDPASAGKGKHLHFGETIAYEVTFENNGSARYIGTVMDRIRLTAGNYAGSLTYNASWQCNATGVTGYQPNGTIPSGGAVTHTSTPPQGAPAIDLRANPSVPLYFEQGGILKCRIKLDVDRPPYNSPFCTGDRVEMENLAMMDVTYPFNPNIAWPASGTVNSGVLQNPTPQDQNWATANAIMPKCYQATLNKEASVPGLPAYSDPWTYENGPQINYTVGITNASDWNLYNGFASGNMLGIEDVYDAPHAGLNHQSSQCSPAFYCMIMGAGERLNLRVALPGSTLDWTYSATNSSQFVEGQFVENTVTMKPNAGGLMDEALGQMYSNVPLPQTASEDVPVVPVTKLQVLKLIDDQTGGNITSGGTFGMNVSCSPYALFNNAGTFTVQGGGTHGIYPVPMWASCTIEETSLAPVPSAAMSACNATQPGSVAAWDDPIYSRSVVSGSNGAPMDAQGEIVTVTNTLKCEMPAQAEVRIKKLMRSPTLKDDWAFDFSLACNPSSSQPSASTVLTNGANSAVTSTSASVGAQCQLNEQLPAFPLSAVQYCANLAVPMVPQWETPQYLPSQTFTVEPGVNDVTVVNKWKCAPPPGSITVRKQFEGTQFDSLLEKGRYFIRPVCDAAATPWQNQIEISRGQAQVTFTAPGGTECEITEPGRSGMPFAITQYCMAQGGRNMRAVWKDPVITPQNVTVQSNAGQLVTVTNGWECKLRDPIVIDTPIGGLGTATRVPGRVSTPKLFVKPPVAPSDPVLQDITGNAEVLKKEAESEVKDERVDSRSTETPKTTTSRRRIQNERK